MSIIELKVDHSGCQYRQQPRNGRRMRL